MNGEWQTLFQGDADFDLLRDKALHGRLKASRFRHVGWMVFLDALSGPPSQWTEQLAAHRLIFDELRERHVIDPKSRPEQDNLAVFNPLSTASDSPWAQYWRNKELEKSIMQDIWRTHPDHPFFQQEWVRKAMLNCLFLFAKENGATAYRQGMHELLAVVMYLVDKEKMTAAELQSSDLRANAVACAALDRAHIEADSFTIFKHLMHSMNQLFEVVDIRVRVQSDGGYIADKKQAEEHAIGQAAIVHRCRRIQYTLLKKFDQPLYNYLKTLSIEPQLYALRWVRLLFGREFQFDDVLTLWDAIFAWGRGLALVDYMAVTMLVYMRESLLGREYTDTMARLMKFPDVEHVEPFVESAIRMASGKAADGQGIPLHGKAEPIDHGRPLVFNASTGSSTSSRASPSPPPSAQSSSSPMLAPIGSVAPKATKTISAAAPLASFSSADAKLTAVLESNAILARRLHSLIDALQQQVLSDEAVLPDMDSIFLTLAELKQMKDILSGALDCSDAHLLFGEKGNPKPENDDEVASGEVSNVSGEEGAPVDAVESSPSTTTLDAAAVEPTEANKEPLAAAAAPAKPAARAKSPVAVQWGDDDEELGSKKTDDSTSWLFGMTK